MAIGLSLQPVIRYTSCLVLGYGFQGQRIEWLYFRLHQIQVGGRPPSWIISNGHISATAHSIHLYSAHRAVIFAIAQFSCSLCYNQRIARGGNMPHRLVNYNATAYPIHRLRPTALADYGLRVIISKSSCYVFLRTSQRKLLGLSLRNTKFLRVILSLY